MLIPEDEAFSFMDYFNYENRTVSELIYIYRNLPNRGNIILLGSSITIEFLFILYSNIELYFLTWVLIFYIILIISIQFSYNIGLMRQLTSSLYVEIHTNSEIVEGFLVSNASDHYVVLSKNFGNIVLQKNHVNMIETKEIPDLESETETACKYII
ncbi:hypothetical protein GF319_09770 [Candidatus Bathyarchaeota archaeon]|nr:hypothetical protein [Candidatus Bathyarchaeota archaeon]